MLFRFDDFELDIPNATLRRAAREIPLTPKAFAVLQYLLERADCLVTKLELWQTVWPGVIVTDAALTVCMSEIRKALEDPARTPHFIATVHRRGYRFIAPVTRLVRRIDNPAPADAPTPLTTNCCGREQELARLHAWWQRAEQGRRTVGFVSGEPGIGKTTLLQAFLARPEVAAQACAAQGQCIEHFGAGEPYLPVLDALGRMCRGPLATPLVLGLERYAPGWLVQMPGLLDDARLAALRDRAAGTPPVRMLRELSEALDVVAREVPMVIVLEDLHWSDHATLDWLAFVARRQEPARMFVLCSYRPVEVIVANHPLRALKQELRAHGLCEEIYLGLLSENAIAAWLATRLRAADASAPDGALHRSLRDFVPILHRRTDGNPLFVNALVEELVTRDLIVERDGQWRLEADPGQAVAPIPDGPQQLIANQLAKVSAAAREVLEAASVLVVTFGAGPLAAVLDQPLEAIESTCAEFARNGQFLRSTLQDDGGSVATTAQFAFTHALYREVVYDNIPAGRRAALHAALGTVLERDAGARADDIAAELALHFERGHDLARAATYYRLAGVAATARSGYVDARALLERGLALLAQTPPSAVREGTELALQLALGPVLIVTTGNASAAVAACYSRARDLCQPADGHEAQFQVLFGLRSHALARGDLGAAHEFGADLLAIAEQSGDPSLRLEACVALGNTYFQLGHPAEARVQLERGAELYDATLHRGHGAAFGMDPGMFCLSLLALCQQLLGNDEQALAHSRAALALAATLDHPYSRATADNFAGWFHQLRAEPEAVRHHTAAALARCNEYGFPAGRVLAVVRQGWACAMDGDAVAGCASIAAGIAAWNALGARLASTHFLAMHAEACGRMGDHATGLASIDEALLEVERTGERWLAADLHRIQGELFAADPARADEAMASWRTAIDIARVQGARFLEARSARLLAASAQHPVGAGDVSTPMAP